MTEQLRAKLQALYNDLATMHDYYRIDTDDIYPLIQSLFIIIQKHDEIDKPFYELVKICLLNNYIDMYERYFLLWESVSIAFRKDKLSDAALKQMLAKALIKNVDEFKSGLNYNFNFLSKNQRNSNRAIIMVSQLLNPLHSPTIAALTVCVNIIEKMNMDVFLINTAESTNEEYAELFGISTRYNYLEEYNNCSYVEHNNHSFRFHQCKRVMPNRDEMIKVFELVSEFKPDFILNIGSRNVTAELCSNLVPVLTADSLYMTLPYSISQFLMLRGRKLQADDTFFLSLLGKSSNCVIDDVELSINLPTQENKISKQQFGLPEDKVLIALAGNRLDIDINTDVINFFNSIAGLNIHIVLIGSYSNLDMLFNDCPELINRITPMGYQKDYQAAIENCDIFINPDRQGNGVIGLLTMIKSVPVITFPNNDVANLLSEDFYVYSYEQMREEITKHISEKEYHELMKRKAYECAQRYIESCNICSAIEKMRSSPMFI